MTLVWLITTVGVAEIAATGGPERAVAAGADGFVQIMVSPEGRLYPPSPIHLSVAKGSRVRWVCKNGVVAVFPVEGFPVLANGARLPEVPFIGMIHKKLPKERWVVDCLETRCESGAINPKLGEVLKQVAGGRLEYRYQLKRTGEVVDALLVLEP